VLILVLSGTVALGACATGVQQRAGLTKSAPNVTMTTPELRVRTAVYAEQFAATVEAAADSIMTGTDDPAIQRRALMWKASAIPMLQQSMFLSDPLAAFIDGWTFTTQMDEFFRDGDGRDLFGSEQPVATRASGRLLRNADELARLATHAQGYANGVEFVTEWSRDHKIESLLFARTPTFDAWAEELGGGARGGLAGVADINESVTILSNRLSLYAASLPKQARWQAQLLVWEVLDDPQARLFLGNIDSIQRDVERIEDQFADIRDVLVDVDDILAGQRLAAFQQMNDEILALADALARQREAIMALVDSGRVAVFEDVSAQRVAAMTELDSIVQHAVDQALRGSDRVIDHLFIRTIQLMAGLIVLGIIGLAILRRRSRTV
jgi:hypothetical protein